MLNDNLPSPLVPADVDLADFAFMPVDVQRLLKSDTWLAAIDNKLIAWACINLWFESWHQKPASSLPGNERLLARIAQVDIEQFLDIQETVMHGWTLCSDGRYYHKVVAEKALEAWVEKLVHRYKGSVGNFRQHKITFDAIAMVDKIEQSKALLRTINPTSKILKRKTTALSDALLLQLEMFPEWSAPANAPANAPALSDVKVHHSGAIQDENNAPACAPANTDGIAPVNTPALPVRTQETETGTETETGIESKNTCGEASSPPSASPSQAARPALSLEFQEAKPSPQSVLDIGGDPVLYRLAALGGKTFYDVTKSYFDAKQEFFPALDMAAEFRKMASWCQDNAPQRKTVGGYPRFINSWLSRAQNALKVQGPGKQRGSQLSAGKWDGIDKKDFKSGIGDDFRF